MDVGKIIAVIGVCNEKHLRPETSAGAEEVCAELQRRDILAAGGSGNAAAPLRSACWLRIGKKLSGISSAALDHQEWCQSRLIEDTSGGSVRCCCPAAVGEEVWQLNMSVAAPAVEDYANLGGGAERCGM